MVRRCPDVGELWGCCSWRDEHPACTPEKDLFLDSPMLHRFAIHVLLIALEAPLVSSAPLTIHRGEPTLLNFEPEAKSLQHERPVATTTLPTVDANNFTCPGELIEVTVPPGTAPRGSECVFPFEYHGTNYTQCTPVDITDGAYRTDGLSAGEYACFAAVEYAWCAAHPDLHANRKVPPPPPSPPREMSTERTFTDDAGVTHTTSYAKPTIVVGVWDGISLVHFGLGHDQLMGTYGERHTSGSNANDVYADGNVNAEELRQYLSARGEDEATTKSLLGTLDGDGDGAISLAELRERLVRIKLDSMTICTFTTLTSN